MRHGEKDYFQLAGEMLRRCRERAGWSQTQLGEQLGEFLGVPAVKRQVIARYEGNPAKDKPADRAVPAYWLLALKDLTGQSLDSLLDEVDEVSIRAELRRLDEEVQALRAAQNGGNKGEATHRRQFPRRS